MTNSATSVIKELPPRQSTYGQEDMMLGAVGKLFGVSNARVPKPPMLMTDRITLITDDTGEYGKGEIKAEFDIKPDLWFFDCHFGSDPVMPGCLGLDALWQLLGFYLVWNGGQGRGRALGVGKVKFSGQILPTSKLVTYQLDIKRVISRKLVLGIADGSVSVDGRKIYTAEDLRVGLFTSTDNF